MKEHHIQDPEDYRHIVVNGNDFISIQEIEQADAASLLYQSGYLTIEKKEEQLLTLDYPNKEVMNSLSSMYLKLIYRVEGYALLGNEIWKALRQGDIPEIVRLYNIAIANIAYDDFASNRNEFWYRSLFIMLLRGAGIISYSEPHTSKGRADVIIQFNHLVVVLEFKFARDSSEVDEKKREGLEQLQERGYAKSYDAEGRKVISAVLVADDEHRGVRSDIINNSAVETAYAQINFLTEREFIDEKIAPYFRYLQEFKVDLFSPVTINEFMMRKLPEPGTFKASPEAETSMNLHLKHLQDLQEHLSQYKEYIGHSPIRIVKEEIREYVAQDNKAGERVFFKHMAVSNVEIFCKFPNQDAGRLRLIDLPGLGDTRKGDVEQVVRALSDQVDLVLFLSKPSTSGAAWQDNEINLYSQARRALGEKLPIERWSFWVFNHDASVGADNQKQCELHKGDLPT